MTMIIRKKFDWEEDRKNFKWWEDLKGFSGRYVYRGRLTWKGWLRKIFGIKKEKKDE